MKSHIGIIHYLGDCMEEAKMLAKMRLKRDLRTKVNRASHPMKIRRMPVRDLDEILKASRKAQEGICE